MINQLTYDQLSPEAQALYVAVEPERIKIGDNLSRQYTKKGMQMYKQVEKEAVDDYGWPLNSPITGPCKTCGGMSTHVDGCKGYNSKPSDNQELPRDQREHLSSEPLIKWHSMATEKDKLNDLDSKRLLVLFDTGAARLYHEKWPIAEVIAFIELPELPK